MTPVDFAQTLCFSASFPPEDQYVSTAGELAGKMAVSAGLSEEDAGALARQVEGAFAKAVAEGAGPIDVALCAGPDGVTTTVTHGPHTLLQDSRPRPR